MQAQARSDFLIRGKEWIKDFAQVLFFDSTAIITVLQQQVLFVYPGGNVNGSSFSVFETMNQAVQDQVG